MPQRDERLLLLVLGVATSLCLVGAAFWLCSYAFVLYVPDRSTLFLSIDAPRYLFHPNRAWELPPRALGRRLLRTRPRLRRAPCMFPAISRLR